MCSTPARLRQRVPLGQNEEYEKMCYFRYLAMAEVGGGWMSDYDTLPMQLLGTSH